MKGKISSGQKAKNILLGFAFLPFIILYLQQLRPFVNLRPLGGDIKSSKTIELNGVNWFSGKYQGMQSAWLNENFGFRNFFVRLHNQLKFSCFKTSSVQEVVVGKDNYLYTLGYIEAYFGLNYVGDKAIRDTVSELSRLQDTLDLLGKKLLVVLAPGKARIYPEFLPQRYSRYHAGWSNYYECVKFMKEGHVNYIDFSEDFLNRKKDSPWPLIPQLGIHWSRLEGIRAADSIIAKLSYLSNTPLPRIKINRVYESDTLVTVDRDIAEAMNMYILPPHRKNAYADFDVTGVENATKNILVIGDSFWWDIYLQFIPKKAFKHNDFWYYFRDLYSSHRVSTKTRKETDVKRAILQNDYIVIVCAESNLGRLGFGFAGAALSAMRRPVTPDAGELQSIIKLIEKNEEWLSEIKQKAAKKNISTEEMLKADANWYFQHHGAPIAVSRKDVTELITSTDTWMTQIREKAAKKNISVDSMISLDADWYMANILGEKPKEEKLSLADAKQMIMNDSKWMEQIKTKAKNKGISADSMLVLDALWLLEQKNAGK